MMSMLMILHLKAYSIAVVKRLGQLFAINAKIENIVFLMTLKV